MVLRLSHFGLGSLSQHKASKQLQMFHSSIAKKNVFYVREDLCIFNLKENKENNENHQITKLHNTVFKIVKSVKILNLEELAFCFI